MLSKLVSRWWALGASMGGVGLGVYSNVSAQGASSSPPGDLRPSPGVSNEMKTGPNLDLEQKIAPGQSRPYVDRDKGRTREGPLITSERERERERERGLDRDREREDRSRYDNIRNREEYRSTDRGRRGDEVQGYSATDGSPPPPGDDRSFMTKSMEMGASMIQNLDPVRSLSIHVDGIMQDTRDKNKLLELHKYCHHVNEDFMQCLLYDDDKADSKLVGVEYLISKRIYDMLPRQEQYLWHSTEHEVKSGISVAPRLPEVAEHKLMEHMANCYAKAWKTWPIEQRAPLPVGIPEMLQPVEDDSVLNSTPLIRKRDQYLGISTDDLRKRREDIKA